MRGYHRTRRRRPSSSRHPPGSGSKSEAAGGLRNPAAPEIEGGLGVAGSYRRWRRVEGSARWGSGSRRWSEVVGVGSGGDELQVAFCEATLSLAVPPVIL